MATSRRTIDWRDQFKGVIDRPSNLSFEECIALSSKLSKLPMIGREQQWEVIRVVPGDIVPVLKAFDIDFMLVGAHGVSGWMMEPRATQDVNVLIRPRDKTKAAQAILKKYPDMELEKCPQVWRFRKHGQVLLDLMLAFSALHKRVFKEFEFIRIANVQVKIPKVECALAMKFTAMVGHYRLPRKKHIDAGDFMSIVEKNSKLDLDFLQELGELQ
jgi:hypothetical protein